MQASNARKVRWSALVLGIAGVLAAWAVIHVRAQTVPDNPDRVSFGMIGVARAQTARLNLVNIRAAAADVGPCRVELQFLDSQGNVVKMSELRLAPGQAGFLDLSRDASPSSSGRPRAIEPDGGDRQQVRAVWTEPDGPDMPQCGRSNFIATVEIFGRDGKTTVLYIEPDVGDAPVR